MDNPVDGSSSYKMVKSRTPELGVTMDGRSNQGDKDGILRSAGNREMGEIPSYIVNVESDGSQLLADPK